MTDEVTSMCLQSLQIEDFHYEDDLQCYEDVSIEHSIEYIINEHKEALSYQNNIDECDDDDDNVCAYNMVNGGIFSNETAISYLKQLASFFETKGMVVESGKTLEHLACLRINIMNAPKVQKSIKDFF